jgi:hypothetical protein
METIEKILLRDSLWYLRYLDMLEKRSKAYDHPLCSIWYGMLNRCYNPMDTSFRLYGARGISVCDRWLDFKNFIEDVGNRNSLTLDRIDPDGDYSPNNCRWATKSQQAKNKRPNEKIRSRRKIEKIMRVKKINTGITNIIPCYTCNWG